MVGADLPPLYCTELGSPQLWPGLSGHIKVISWALLALEVLFFGWGGVRSITGSMRFKVNALK